MTHQSIFVTDDNQSYVELMEDILRDAGYSQVICYTGQNAFKEIHANQPDLILLDINLTNPSNGWSILDSLQLHPKTRHIQVIICSTDMRMVNQKAAMLHELGYQVLEKPFDLETLLEKVASAIGLPPPATS